MSPIADSRQVVLDRIRAATRNWQGPMGPMPLPIARDYVRRGTMETSARLERLIERLREYDAEVVECEPEGLVAAIRAQLTASGRRTFVAPAGLPREWLVPGFNWMIDGDFAAEEIERADGVVTACFCAIAESGTIALHHSATEGRRVISLLPDWHLCVVYASQVVETLPEYFDRCREQGNKGTREPENSERGDAGTREQVAPGLPRLVTWIAGPSATADIEMTRIKGVHGPRFLNVILVKDQG
jgi:L-lactate dehydrogenase complex protein LldG